MDNELTFEELERLAASGNQVLPDALSPPRQMLFLSLRAMHQSYRMKQITVSQATEEKKKLLRMYMDADLNYKIYLATAQMRNRLSKYLTEIELSGCPKCQLAIKIFDGRA